MKEGATMTNVTIKFEKTKPFGRLYIGDYFLADEYAWIKVATLEEDDCNAVRLNDGNMWRWDNETEVFEIQNVTISFN